MIINRNTVIEPVCNADDAVKEADATNTSQRIQSNNSRSLPQ